jgi:hypothetical protein
VKDEEEEEDGSASVSSVGSFVVRMDPSPQSVQSPLDNTPDKRDGNPASVVDQ